MDFDGTGDYVLFPTELSFTSGSILIWTQVDTVRTYDSPFSMETADEQNTIEFATTDGSAMNFVIVDGGITQASIPASNMSDGDSMFLAGTFETNSVKFYVDGSQISTTDTTATIPTELLRVAVGGEEDGTTVFSGKTWNALVFNRVLSAQEVSDIYYGTTFDMWQDLVLSSDLSEINPQDLWGSNSGTGTGLTASSDIVLEHGEWAIETNGSDEKVDFGDIGTIRTIELWVDPDTTTEELVLVDTGKDIMVSGGTVTYTGLTATNTFVDGVDTDTMVANKRQHVVCVLNADVDANNFELANDGSNYGAGRFYEIAVYDTALEQLDAEDRYVEGR